jgi:hypothetical protein
MARDARVCDGPWPRTVGGWQLDDKRLPNVAARAQLPSALDRSHGESGDEPARAGVLSLRKSGGVETGLTPPPHFQTKSPLCGATEAGAGGGEVDPEGAVGMGFVLARRAQARTSRWRASGSAMSGSRPSAAHGDEERSGNRFVTRS